MRKIRIIEQISLDGVIHAPGGAGRRRHARLSVIPAGTFRSAHRFRIAMG
jgi:hypothetical protein